ncbi:MAG: hypothetical protein KKE62_15770 [Proteobacteria bacterium]|nr:hypothetical protein [Pseudomonadota bacterium]MBU1387306.1 hypothetical protein [Pseudomonadota bacterium]MBU1544288.1 hypothetical protein [Pseudomonadota bacterium]MBU2430317.1 hypothetical protein [Pseudomonadota bacterium]MBU2481142.1 hypothetical protein [Pseudomonadota bacterium]
MQFQRGNKIEVYKKSDDEAWEDYMDDFIGCHGFVTDPDTTINDPDALIEISLEGRGTHRLPQDCLKLLTQNGDR